MKNNHAGAARSLFLILCAVLLAGCSLFAVSSGGGKKKSGAQKKSAPAKLSRPAAWAVWDVCDIYENEIKYRMSDGAELLPDSCLGDDGKPDEEKVRAYVYQDTELQSFEWECLTDNLTEEMKNRNPGGYWYATVDNFGWRHQSGRTVFHAVKGAELLRRILPDTDCTFWVHLEGRRGFAVENAHHDAPMGGEWYHVRPATNAEIENYS